MSVPTMNIFPNPVSTIWDSASRYDAISSTEVSHIVSYSFVETYRETTQTFFETTLLPSPKPILIDFQSTLRHVETATAGGWLVYSGSAGLYYKATSATALLIPAKTTMQTVTITKSPTYPHATTSTPESRPDGKSRTHLLALEVALPLCLVTFGLLLSFWWHRQRRRNEENESVFDVPSPSQRNEWQRWWKRNFGPASGHTTTGRREKAEGNNGLAGRGEAADTQRQQRSEEATELETMSRSQQPGHATELEARPRLAVEHQTQGLQQPREVAASPVPGPAATPSAEKNTEGIVSPF